MTRLETKIQFLHGVGPKMGAKLNKLGLETAQDLIFYYPRAYLDFTQITKISEISNREDQKVTIRGKILGISNKKTSRRRFTVTEAVVEDGTGSIKVVWFNQPFLLKMLPAGREVILHGKISFNFYSREVVMESPERTLYPRIEPIYGETAGLTSRYISKLVASSMEHVARIKEWLPENIIKQNNLLGIQEALLSIHFPKNSEMMENARRRIAFDELFMISLRANLSKEEIKKENVPKIDIRYQISDNSKQITDSPKGAPSGQLSVISKFIESLPFELTSDQKKAAEQILKDMSKSVPMNRLLNGDVGSGKTVVAAMAAYAAVKAGFKVALMVPTEILAQQHFKTFCALFKNREVSIGIFTANCKDFRGSRVKGQGARDVDQKKLGSRPSALDADIIIGTQALIQKDVELENLGLVIVDEQHRFGVAQRAALQQLGRNKKQDTITKQIPNSKLKGSKLITDNCQLTTAQMRPHFLSMTATPIPRTLHLSLFGDLDISVIKEKPANRKEIKTRLVEPQNREKAYEFIRAHIQAGRQAFVICPLIEENTDDSKQITELFDEDRKSVKAEYEKLQKVFPEFKIGMLHGKMRAKEKDVIMDQFCANELNILVSTSVVEVGVDVPNASVMVIEDAERFGLAQIHQFRGRVGRAEHQSFCLLFSSTRSEKAISRLRALEATSDGFRLAEIDLEQRGPGAVFGTEQSGMLDLKMANFSDRELIEEASTAAKSIVETDPELTKHPLLKQKVADYLQNKHLE